MSHLDKSGSTGVTVVGLFSRVNAGVGLQVGWSVELGTAHIAAIRLLSCRGHNKHISCCDYTHGHNHLLLYESHCPKRCTLKHSKHLCMLCVDVWIFICMCWTVSVYSPTQCEYQATCYDEMSTFNFTCYHDTECEYTMMLSCLWMKV